MGRGCSRGPRTKDPEGAKLLKRLNLGGFIAGEERLYEPVVRMVHELGEE